MGNVCFGSFQSSTSGLVVQSKAQAKKTEEFYITFKTNLGYDLSIVKQNTNSTAVDALAELGRKKSSKILKGSSSSNNMSFADIHLMLENNGSQLNVHSNIAPPSSIEETKVMRYSLTKRFNTNELFDSLIQLEKKHLNNEEIFLQTVAKYPNALKLLTHFRLDLGRKFDTIVSLHHKAHEYCEKINPAITIAKNAQTDYSGFENKVEKLRAAIDLFAKQKGKYSYKKQYESSVLEDQIELLKEQERLEVEIGQPCLLNLSLVDTIWYILLLIPKNEKNLHIAMDLANKFLISPKHFWWLLLSSMKESEQWEILFQMVISATPPIGYGPVVDTFIQGNRHDLAHQTYGLIKDDIERENVDNILSNIAKA